MGSAHPKERGQRSEAAILNELVCRGVTVLRPFGDDERYDLVADVRGELHRVQVKTGRMENGRVQFDTRSSTVHTQQGEKRGYEGDIEVFAVYSPDLDDSFVVPVEEAPKTTMGLRVETAAKESPRTNHAADYRLERWLEAV